MHHHNLSNVLNKEQRLVLLIIGLIEAIPLVVGILLTERLSPVVFLFDYALLGLITSVLLMYHLGKYAPQIPIHQTHHSKIHSA